MTLRTRMQLRNRAARAAVAALLGLWPASSVAQPQATEPAAVATARGLAVAGVQLAESDRCPEALLKLERAEEIHHAPVVVYHIGACHIRLGRLVQGTELLRGLLREPKPEPRNAAVEDAHRRAAELVEQTRPRIATLTVLLDAPRGKPPRVLLDGLELPQVLIGVPRAIDPGEHTLQAQAPGTSSTVQKVIIAPGQTRVVAIALSAMGAVAADAAPRVGGALTGTGEARSASLAPAPLAQATPARAESSSWHLPSMLAWGVSATALVVGIGYGWAALQGSDALDQSCPQRMCPPESHARLDSERNHATISTIAFAVAAASAATGTVLYLTREDADTEPARRAGATRPRARLQLGPGAVRVGLQF